ncbi:NAD(P)H-dependent oxidoreductase [soil metagenome]
MSDKTNGESAPPDSVHVKAIMGSTRQGRIGETVARWFMSVAGPRNDLSIELIDLRDWPLPFFDESKPPSSGHYAVEAEGWANKIAGGEAFVIITPEYNLGYPGVLKNALDHLYTEWNGKPVAFVGYGSTSAGSRSVSQLRQVVVGLQMLPLSTEILIQSPREKFDEHGNIKELSYSDRANTLLDDLVTYARAMTPLRSQKESAPE